MADGDGCSAGGGSGDRHVPRRADRRHGRAGHRGRCGKLHRPEAVRGRQDRAGRAVVRPAGDGLIRGRADPAAVGPHARGGAGDLGHRLHREEKDRQPGRQGR